MSNYQNANVVKIRVVVHTLGLDGWDKSRNHWSIYLILPGETASVRLNMSLSQGSDENGTFTATDHAYAVTNSQLTCFDYPATPGLRVGNVINLVYHLRRERYRMTGSGNGCRFWVWTILQDFVRANYIANATAAAVSDFGNRIQRRYHKNAQGQIIMINDAMEVGEFV